MYKNSYTSLPIIQMYVFCEWKHVQVLEIGACLILLILMFYIYFNTRIIFYQPQ